jgi:hypothetical protein
MTLNQEYVRNTTVSVGTSSTVIADAQPVQRQDLYIRNSGTGGEIITVHLGFGTAVANEGIVLENGQAFTMTEASGYQCYSGVVTCISDTASTTVTVMER